MAECAVTLRKDSLVRQPRPRGCRTHLEGLLRVLPTQVVYTREERPDVRVRLKEKESRVPVTASNTGVRHW